MKIKESYKGTVSLVISAAIYASFAVFIREMNKMFGVYSQVTARYLVVILISLAIIIISKSSLKVKRSELLRIVFFSVVFPISVIFFTISALRENISTSVFLLYGVSLVSSFIIGNLVLREKTDKQKLIATLLAFIGVVIFSGVVNNQLSLSLGFIAGIAAGFFDSLSNISRKLVKGIDWRKLLFYQFSFGAILTIILSLITKESFVKEFHASSLIITIIFGASLALLSRLLLYGFSRVDVNVATPILASELVLSVLFGYVFFKEVPSGSQIIGGLFILAATITASIDVTKFSKKPSKSKS